ncbi:hypothetical protein QJS04_geneDACA013206 [Acorus gramineus]|uniref:Uncharacterized protein n=1 Tax=Acorus gramineus TaxID=55184 RepID=A0AAV9B9K0_ACOGR|nr:hypothetical protein QJS04_geneDACA013206 [Acorus gramineus]
MKTPTKSLSSSSSASSNHIRATRRYPSASSSVIVALSLLLATSAWLSLISSSSHHHHHHHLLLHLSDDPNTTPPLSSSSSSSLLSPPSLLPHRTLNTPSTAPGDTSLDHIVFGIAGSAHLWRRRREFVRLWWRPNHARGHVWLDESPPDDETDPSLPPIRVSEDISRFRYTNPTGHPSGLRISRIVSESFRLGLPNVRWFFLCDDDTIVNVENLIGVLNKYDPSEMVYIGTPSESHSANTYFSHSMAFGGGGIAISYPLAEALSVIQDDCLERYPKLYGSDDRLHACISELGVPLSRELGFHQWDIRGNAHGLLAAHPVAPFVSIHHVEAVDPIYPGLSSLNGLKLFARAMHVEPWSFLQRSICYDRTRRLSFAVSLGYVVQVYPNIVLPRELERSEQTFVAWNRLSNRNEFDFDTRDAHRSVCKKPILFFLKDVGKDGNATVGLYGRAKMRDDLKRKVFCFPRSLPLHEVHMIRVVVNRLSEKWHLVPRRLCCKVNQSSSENLRLVVGQCERGSFGSVADSM